MCGGRGMAARCEMAHAPACASAVPAASMMANASLDDSSTHEMRMLVMVPPARQWHRVDRSWYLDLAPTRTTRADRGAGSHHWRRRECERSAPRLSPRG